MNFVEMRTELGRTFGVEVIYKGRRYLYDERDDGFYKDVAGIPKVSDEELIKELRRIYESQK